MTEQSILPPRDRREWRNQIVLELLNDYCFRTMLYDELFVYDSRSGIWRQDIAEQIVKSRVQRQMGHGSATEYEKRTIISCVKDSTSIYPEYNSDTDFWNVPLNLICVQNGILDVFTKKLIPHSAEYHFRQRIPVEFIPRKDPRLKGKDRVRTFMNEVADGNEKDVLGHYEMIGYFLYRSYPFQKAFLEIGGGDNGKSTFNELMRRFLGAENVANISLQGLCANRFSVANLIGKLANMYSDITANELKSTGMFKMLTGGDPVDAEKKNVQKRFKFVNYAKLVFSCNQVPKASKDDTRAFWKRWIPSYFTRTFEGKTKKNRNELLKELTEKYEMSVLLLDALHGLNRLISNGKFSHERGVDETRTELLLVSDPEKFFCEEKLEEDMTSYEIKNVVYDEYLKVCRQYKLHPCAKNWFTQRLKQHTMAEPCQRRVGNKMANCYCGIKFKDENIRLLDEDGKPKQVYIDKIRAEKGQGKKGTLKTFQEVLEDEATQNTVETHKTTQHTTEETSASSSKGKGQEVLQGEIAQDVVETHKAQHAPEETSVSGSKETSKETHPIGKGHVYQCYYCKKRIADDEVNTTMIAIDAKTMGARYYHKKCIDRLRREREEADKNNVLAQFLKKHTSLDTKEPD